MSLIENDGIYVELQQKKKGRGGGGKKKEGDFVEDQKERKIEESQELVVKCRTKKKEMKEE
jgi:hypothetical protein